MGETFGYIELPSVVAGEDNGHPLAEGRRTQADVDSHVVHFPLKHGYQFALGVGMLEVQAPKDTGDRKGQVVLDEAARKSVFPVAAGVPCFQEVAAVVDKAVGFDDKHSGDGCFQAPHAGLSPLTRLNRYSP